MSTNSTRLLLGFVAGFASHLLFQGGIGALLYAMHLLPGLSWSLDPVPPFGVPRTINLGFWAGLWGALYAAIEPWLTARLGRLGGGLAYGLAPLAVFWFVVLPLKGAGVGGGFEPAMIPIHLAFHAAYGVGVAILFGLGVAFTRRSTNARAR